MKEIETGKDKIQKICDLLKRETLEPAKQEAREIVENAKMQAEQLLQKAKEDAESELHQCKEEIEKRKKNFDDSLQFAIRQILEELKQTIEKRFFRDNLSQLLQEKLGKADVLAELLSATIEAIRKEGIESDLTVQIGKKVSAEKLAALLADRVFKEVKNKELLLGEFEGGVRIRIQDKNMTIDLSDEALRDLIAEYIREDFRYLIFQK